MSSKARRLVDAQGIEPYDWSGQNAGVPRPFRSQAPSPVSHPPVAPVTPVAPAVDRATIERDAFAQGFAQGERAGAETSAARADGVLRRLAQTLDELQALRAEMIHKTERQVVQLAIAIAKRIVHREISLDGDLLMAMARVALDRLGETTNATIHLHPEDYAATAGARGAGAGEAGVVRVVADPAVRRGGCLVQSDFGLIDVSADAQIQELTTALLGGDEPAPPANQAEAALVGG